MRRSENVALVSEALLLCLASVAPLQVKEVLKSLKGSWNRIMKGWIFPGSKRDEVLEALRKDPSNTVTESDEAQPGAEKASKQQKLDDDFINDDDSDDDEE